MAARLLVSGRRTCKFVVRAGSLDELVGLGTLTRQAATFLEAAVVAGLNIIVAGGTQAGKTTLLNCLAGAIPGSERIITAEEVFELKLAHPDVVAMQTRQANLEGTGEIVLRRLVKEALRMRPDRIIVGEVREQECLDLLMVPLVYVLLSAFQVQRASFGVSEAARQAGRAYATAPDLQTARERAQVAATLALRDQGITAEPELEVSCQGGCLEPEAIVTVTVRHVVRLPVLSLLGDAAPSIPVRATHDAVVDRFKADG